MEVAKGFFEQYDEKDNGMVKLSDFIKILQGPYKCLFMPWDIIPLVWEYIEDDTGLDDYILNSFEAFYNKDLEGFHSQYNIRYWDFMKEVTRPYIYEIASKYTNLEFTGVLAVMFNCLTLVCNMNRLSL